MDNNQDNRYQMEPINNRSYKLYSYDDHYEDGIQNNTYKTSAQKEHENYLDEKNLSRRIIQAIIDFVIITIIFFIFIIVFFTVEPKISYITCDESDIFYPFIEDTVPFWAVGIYATLGPILLVVLVELVNSYIIKQKINVNRKRKFLICTFHALSLFILGISIVLLLTDIGKRWVGRLRPHFISVCKPNFSKLNCTSSGLIGFVYNAIYTGDNFCTGASNLVKEARFSFPSGHSSYSVYSMVFLIVYLEARLFLLKFRYVKSLFQMFAFIAAFVTCLSRISDYHHRGTDVLGGTCLGILF